MTKAFKIDIDRVLEETDCRPTDYLCYDIFGGKYCTSNSIPQGLISPPFWPFQEPVQSEIRHTFSEMGYWADANLP